MRGSLLQCSYVSLGSETSQTALAASREKYHRAKSQVCANELNRSRGRALRGVARPVAYSGERLRG